MGEMTTKPFCIHERGVSLLYILAIVAVIAVVGFAIYKFFFPAPVPKSSGSNLVRGYLAATVGRSANPEFRVSYSLTTEGKNIYLPGVAVYLEDLRTGKRSDSARTDLSGRFTLYAPYSGRYRICWRSKVYGSGCTPVFVNAGSAPQFVSTLN